MKNHLAIKILCGLLALVGGLLIGEGIKHLIQSPIPTLLAIGDFIRAFSPIIVGLLAFVAGITWERERRACRLYDATHRPISRFR